ncbi:hypothetical protein BDV12DRAFT_203809 [Aspergillus spectabilis]
MSLNAPTLATTTTTNSLSTPLHYASHVTRISAGDRADFTHTSVYQELTHQKTDFFAQWYEHEFVECLTFDLSMDRLQLPGYKEKLVLMLGDDSEGLAFPTDPVMIMARVLGIPVVRVPGGYMGYVTREEEFGERFRVLWGGRGRFARL